MLCVDDLRAGYGGGTVLHGITLAVPAGAVHVVVGHNGAGKTTLLHTIAGLLHPAAGRIHLGDRDLTGQPAHRIARAGVALVPQGRRVFASLTVAEHLTLTRHTQASIRWPVDRILALFPQLGHRLAHRGGQLSGGEQQMLAIARALRSQPRTCPWQRRWPTTWWCWPLAASSPTSTPTRPEPTPLISSTCWPRPRRPARRLSAHRPPEVPNDGRCDE